MHDLILQKLDAAIQASDSEAEKKAITSTKAFEQKHYDVLKKYGRYPSRNEALDRKSTPEEEEMLKNGPGW